MGDNLHISPENILEFAIDGKAVTTRLQAINNGANPVALKVMTTKPGRYFVMPNNTIIPSVKMYV